MVVGATGGELRFLDPAVIARIGSIELKARTIVEGFLAGLHRSPFKGFSVEFAEYRQYLLGDDLSTIDWKVYARSDKESLEFGTGSSAAELDWIVAVIEYRVVTTV